jgi:hypothetical protein
MISSTSYRFFEEIPSPWALNGAQPFWASKASVFGCGVVLHSK